MLIGSHAVGKELGSSGQPSRYEGTRGYMGTRVQEYKDTRILSHMLLFLHANLIDGNRSLPLAEALEDSMDSSNGSNG